MLDIKLKKPRQQKIFLFLIGIFFVSSCSSSPTLSFDDLASVTSTTISTSTTSTTSVNTTDSTSFEETKLNYDQTVRQQFQELVRWQDKCYQQPK